MDFLEIFSENLKKIKKEKGISIKEMAKITGISEQFLKKIDNLSAKRIKLFHLEKLCKTLNPDIKNLFYNK